MCRSCSNVRNDEYALRRTHKEFEGDNGCFVTVEVSGCAIICPRRLDSRLDSQGRCLLLRLVAWLRRPQSAFASGRSLSIGDGVKDMRLRYSSVILEAGLEMNVLRSMYGAENVEEDVYTVN